MRWTRGGQGNTRGLNGMRKASRVVERIIQVRQARSTFRGISVEKVVIEGSVRRLKTMQSLRTSPASAIRRV